MKTKDVLDYYGSATRVAMVLDCNQCTISRWGELVPIHAAIRLEVITNGQLKLTPLDYFVPQGELTTKTRKH